MRAIEGRRGKSAFRFAGAVLSVAALAALWNVLRQNDWQEVVRPLIAAQLGWLGAGLAMALLVEALKTIRWLLLLDAPMSTLPRLLSLVFSSRLLNTIAPIRAGDIWRVASVSRSEDRPLVLATGSVLLEKVMDGATLAVVAALSIGSTAALPRKGWVEIGVITAAVVVAILMLGRSRRRSIRIRLSAWIQPMSHLRRWQRLAGIALLTVGGIASGLVVNLAALAALGLPVQPSLAAAMLVSAYASGLLPAAPGQVGIFELAVGGSLIASGLAPGSAIAAAVAVHLVLLATLAVGGAISVPLGTLGITSEQTKSTLHDCQREGAG